MGTKLDRFLNHPVWLVLMIVVCGNVILDSLGIIPGPRKIDSPASTLFVVLNVLVVLYAATGLYDHYRRRRDGQ